MMCVLGYEIILYFMLIVFKLYSLFMSADINPESSLYIV